MIKRLTHDHDRLRATMDSLDVFLRLEEPTPDINFARLRWTLIRELNVHVAFERRALPALFAETSRPTFHRGLDHSLDAALTAHMIEWSAQEIQTNWPDYRTAATKLLDRLRWRMTYEERTLFPAVA